MIEYRLLIDLVMLLLVVAAAVAATTLRSLIAASMMLGIYSLLLAATWVTLSAPDVAFTEAAVGAGLSTTLILAALVRTGSDEKKTSRPMRWPALLVIVPVGLALAFAAVDLPDFGDPEAPAHLHVGGSHLELSLEQTGVPNVVTAVLASYRAYDTLFEVAVIFTAGVSMLLLLTHGRGGASP